MKRSELFKLLAGLGAVSSLALVSCGDTLGVPDEPEDLRVTRVTYTYADPASGLNVFADTSAPRLCPNHVLVDGAIKNRKDAGMQPVDECAESNYSDSGVPGKVPAPKADFIECCYGTNRDSFSSDATPAPVYTGEFRVVFNKVPTLMGGKELEVVKRDPAAPLSPMYTLQSNTIAVSCDECGGNDGVPPGLTYVLHPDGSYLSFDPSGNTSGVQIAYGPAISILTDGSNGLEPGSTYHFTVNSAMAGRNAKQIGQYDTEQKRLTTFKTEAFRIAALGIGDPMDPAYDGSNAVKGLANDGAIALTLNAAADDAALVAATVVSAKFKDATTGVETNVPAKIGINQWDGADYKSCDPGLHSQIYVAPISGAWAAAGTKGTVTVTLNTANVYNLSWNNGAPAGKGHASLGGTQTITATLTGANADAKYTGITSDVVASKADCTAPVATPDMAVKPDMATAVDMATKG